MSFRDECAVIGVWNHEEASRMAYLGLYAMQHRGQESAGIVSLHSSAHFSHKGLGLVGDVFTDAKLNALPGEAAIGHVRYSTTGQNLLTNAQPLTAQLRDGSVAVAHNGNLVNADSLRRELQSQGSIFQGTNDTECFLHLFSRAQGQGDLVHSLKASLSRLKGAYSLVVLTEKHLIAIRDPLGFRPLVLGQRTNSRGETSYLVTSETCALDLVGATFVREIEPGEILIVDKTGLSIDRLERTHETATCIFEHVYFARPDSVVFGKSVYESRKNFGRILAQERPIEADVIVPVPDSGVPSAIGYSQQSGIPMEFGIIRNHYVGRTFIQPHQSIRDFGVRVKLNAQAAVLKGKRVVVIDDSLVRGTTSKKIVALLRAAGATEVHMRIASPPTIGPCFYGVDTPQKSQLIAANQSQKEIQDFIGADTLYYLSQEGLFSGVGSSRSIKGRFCAACFNGEYPTELS